MLTAVDLIQELRTGDLLFQLKRGGEAEWAISRLFAGYGGLALNHVGIYTGDSSVIEAVVPRVQSISLQQFLDLSLVDVLGRTCVLVMRLLPEYQHQVALALEFAQAQLALPYNHGYGSRSCRRSWYCSQLVLEAFRYANGGKLLFPETSMSFRDIDSGRLLDYWVRYYEQLQQPLPEGAPGSHPALLSCSEKLTPIIMVGGIPVHNIHIDFVPESNVELV